MKPKVTRKFVRRPRIRRPEIDVNEIRYDNIEVLDKITGNTGQIRSRRFTGLSAKHQRKASKAIKQSRHLGLIPYCTDEARNEA